jgi:methyl-accepting chemotaxis protein
MERMRELVQQTTSSSTELAASAEQMSKQSRELLDLMSRFELTKNGRRSEEPSGRNNAARYAAAGSRG